MVRPSPRGSTLSRRVRTPRVRRALAALLLSALLLAALLVSGLAPAGVTRADDPVVVEITIRANRFVPEEIAVPAGKPLLLRIRNQDATAEEFESHPLKIEKVIPGRKSATVRVRALEKGRYTFFGEYHEASAKGALIAE